MILILFFRFPLMDGTWYVLIASVWGKVGQIEPVMMLNFAHKSPKHNFKNRICYLECGHHLRWVATKKGKDTTRKRRKHTWGGRWWFFCLFDSSPPRLSPTEDRIGPLYLCYRLTVSCVTKWLRRVQICFPCSFIFPMHQCIIIINGYHGWWAKEDHAVPLGWPYAFACEEEGAAAVVVIMLLYWEYFPCPTHTTGRPSRRRSLQ